MIRIWRHGKNITHLYSGFFRLENPFSNLPIKMETKQTNNITDTYILDSFFSFDFNWYFVFFFISLIWLFYTRTHILLISSPKVTFCPGIMKGVVWISVVLVVESVVVSALKKDVLPFVKLYIIALNNMLCLCLWWMCRWVINGDLYFRLAVSIELWLNYNFLSEMEGIILVRCKCFILNMFSYILKCKLYQFLIFSQGLKQFKIVL